MPKSLSKTPAPKKDRIYGSDKNKVGSASSKASAKGIELSESIIATLSQKAKDYNENHPNSKVSLATLKAVMRRGMGAYSTSHRPTITGGAPNSRQAWGFARVNKFLKKKAGQQVKAAYVQDDDLMADGGDVKKFAFIEKWEGGFYWLITKDGDNNYYNVDGDKKLSVVKDMAKRWGYNLVTKKQYEKMLSDSKLADGGETKKSKEAYTIVGVYKSTNDLGREESEDLTKEGLLGYRIRYNKMPLQYYAYVGYENTESDLERAKSDVARYNKEVEDEKQRKKARDLENKIKREKQKIIDAQKLEAAKSDDTPKPAYLMTKSEYEDRVIPLLKEYEKFARKNDKYLSFTTYSGFYKVAFEQVLSRGLDGKVTGYYFRNNDEKELIKNWNQRKFRKYEDFTIPEPTPKDILEKNIAFFKDLNKFFDEKVIFDGLTSDYKKSNKAEIRRAIEDDTYKKMIENGEITEDEVIKIAEEQGVKVPKKVFTQESLLKKEAKKQMDEILSKIPKMNQEVFESLYKQLFDDFKDVEKIVIEQETERFEGLIKEYIELSEKEGGVNVERLQTAIVFWKIIFKKTEPLVIKSKDYRGYTITEYFFKNLKLEDNYKPVLDKIILDYAESLKYRFLKAVLDNFPRVSKPISNITRKSIKVGKKGFEGVYRFNFADGSYFDFVTEAIPAAGYNIVSFHYRYITHLENATLADGTKIKGYYEIMQNFSSDSMADGGQVGVTKIAEDVYISKDKDKLPKDATIVIHRYNDKIKAGELGLFAGNLEDMELDNGYGDNKAYISIGKNAKVKKIRSTERYLSELGELNKPRTYIQEKYGYDSLEDLIDDAGSLDNPSDAWYERQKVALDKMRESGEDFEVLEMMYEEDYIPHQYLITSVKDKNISFEHGGAVGGSVGQEITCVNCGWHWNTSDSDESDKYICHKCGFDNRTFYDPEFVGKYENGGVSGKSKVYYHGSNVLFEDIRFMQKDSGESLRLGEGVYVTNDIEVAKKYGKYIYELITEEPLISLNYTSDIPEHELKEIIRIFENSYDDDLNSLAVDYQYKLDDGELMWGNSLISDLERYDIDVNKTLISLGYNSISQPINKLNSFLDWDENSLNINVIKKGILHILSVNSSNENDNYADGGLIAPNGKKSNLTPEQYKLVRTPEFKAWFGDWENDPENASKVVDENGEPLVVYRGFNKVHDKGFVFKFNINRFKNNRKTNKFGHYFTISEKVAKEYAEQGEKQDEKDIIIKSYFLNIRNLLDITKANKRYPTFEEWSVVREKGFRYSKYDILEKLKRREIPIHSYLFDEAPLDVKDENDLDEVSEAKIKQLEKIIAKQDAEMKEFYNASETISLPALIHIITGESREVIDQKLNELQENESLKDEAYVNRYIYDWFIKYKSKDFRFMEDLDEYLKKLIIDNGYDGVKFIENMIGSVRGLTDSVYVTFESNQIKLADGTNTTFDSKNPDIRYADGGATDFSKVVSASSRFRPMETIVFDPPLVGLNGAKLISYTWSFQWDTSFTKSEGEAISKRVSDWTQADISAETGRDIVHKYTIQMPNGDLKVVSSDSVPVLLGYTDRAQKSSFPNLSNAAKTLAKQKLQLSIIEAKAKEKSDAIAEIVAKGIPEVRVEEGGFRGYKFIIGDSVCLGDDPNDKERLECPKDGYIKNRLKEMGIDVYKDYNTYDLKNRIERQERKIKDILNGKTTAEMGMEIPSQHDLIKMELGLELFKPSKTIEQIAKEKDVPLDYAEEQLRKGMKTESEHSDNPIVQETIALQHLDEMIDYYDKLEYMESQNKMAKGDLLDNSLFNKALIYKSIKPIRQANEIIERLDYMEIQNKMAKGGITEFYKQYQDWYKGGVSDKMTIMVSVPNAFSKMSSEDNHVILDVFEKRDESVDGKEKLKELLELADKNGIDVYLEPIPRHNHIKDSSKKEKITREYLISYYEKFGFELLPNGFMVRKHGNIKMEDGGQVPNEIKENPIYKILLEKSKQDSFTKVKVKMPSLDKINLFLRDIGIDVATPRQSKDFLKAGQFYTLIYGYEGQEPRKRTNYHIDISRLDGYYSRNTPYYAKEILKYIDNFYKENQMEKGGYYKAGGEINPDDKNVKDYFSHGSGNVGGVLVGKRHSEGGIKAVNKSTNQPLEMEGGEVVITRNAVSDDTKREFEGKMMTNREILSKINESGGGVSFADGGDIPESIYTSGKEYKYGGKMMKDHEIVSSCGCKHSMAEGGMVKDANKLEIGDKIKISEGYQGTFIYEVLSGARQGVRPSEIVYQVKIIDSTEPNDYFHIGKVFYKMFTKRLGRFSKVSVLEKGGYMADGGETDYQTELKNHLFPKVEVEVEVEVEPEMELMPIHEHYITADDLGLSDGMPMLAVGTIVYSSGGNDQWEVVSFSDDGVNLVNKPKSPLQSKMEDKHLTFDELIKYFKDKAISIKNISTERELEPAIALVKNKLPQKSYAMGGFIDGDEDEDAKIMQSQFGKSNFK